MGAYKMSDNSIDEPKLPKRQAKLIYFSLAILILGLSPSSMQSSFVFIGISFKEIDSGYLWGWSIVLCFYLLLSWFLTMKSESSWFSVSKNDFNNLQKFKDLAWWGFILPRYKEKYRIAKVSQFRDMREFSSLISDVPFTFIFQKYVKVMNKKDLRFNGNLEVDPNALNENVIEPYSRHKDKFKEIDTLNDNGMLVYFELAEIKGVEIFRVKSPRYISKDNQGNVIEHIPEAMYSEFYNLKYDLLFSVFIPVLLGVSAFLLSVLNYVNSNYWEFIDLL